MKTKSEDTGEHGLMEKVTVHRSSLSLTAPLALGGDNIMGATKGIMGFLRISSYFLGGEGVGVLCGY